MSLDASQFLFHQLANSFSVQDSPIWMDSSTRTFCDNMEMKLGGPQVSPSAIAIWSITYIFLNA